MSYGQDWLVSTVKIQEGIIKRLSTENSRLRDALEHLSKDPSWFCCDCPDIREFCRDALEEK